MSNPDSGPDSELRQRSLSRWENEGGAESEGSQTRIPAIDDQYDLKVTKVEYADLHARLIALENMVISLLVTASDRQLVIAREMADYIAPRPGFTQHPLTVDAANHMNQLVDRALQFRDS